MILLAFTGHGQSTYSARRHVDLLGTDWLQTQRIRSRSDVNVLWTCSCRTEVLVELGSCILTLLVGCQEEHPACRSWLMRCWRDCLSGVRCRLSAYCLSVLMPLPPQNPVIACLIYLPLVLPFWYWLTEVVLENRLFNGCSYQTCILQNRWAE